MKISSTLILSAFALSLTALPACDEKKDDKKEEAKADDKKAEEKKEEEAKEEEAKEEEAKEEGGEEEAAEGEGGGGADEIGVPECDEYITKYLKCIEEKIPDAAKEQTKQAVQQSIDAWKQAAQGPAKDTLAETCKNALETAKKATAAMGCEW